MTDTPPSPDLVGEVYRLTEAVGDLTTEVRVNSDEARATNRALDLKLTTARRAMGRATAAIAAIFLMFVLGAVFFLRANSALRREQHDRTCEIAARNEALVQAVVDFPGIGQSRDPARQDAMQQWATGLISYLRTKSPNLDCDDASGSATTTEVPR